MIALRFFEKEGSAELISFLSMFPHLVNLENYNDKTLVLFLVIFDTHSDFSLTLSIFNSSKVDFFSLRLRSAIPFLSRLYLLSSKYCVTIFFLTGVYKLFMFFNISNENFPESLISFSTNGWFRIFHFIVVFWRLLSYELYEKSCWLVFILFFKTGIV